MPRTSRHERDGSAPTAARSRSDDTQEAHDETDHTSRRPLPASETKHLPLLVHPVPGTDLTVTLKQLSAVPASAASSATPPDTRAQINVSGDASSDGRPVCKQNDVAGTSSASSSSSSTGTTGTTLWLSAQVLAAYLSTLPQIHKLLPLAPAAGYRASTVPKADSLSRNGSRAGSTAGPCRPLALDLGSGTAFLPLCLAAWGWDVIATDISPVTDLVLRPNITRNLADWAVPSSSSSFAHPPGPGPSGTGRVWAREVDWTQPLPPPAELLLPAAAPPALPLPTPTRQLDLILTSDTVYHPPLVAPLWRTVRFLLDPANGYARPHRRTACYLALERRDPGLVDAALRVGREAGLVLSRVDGGVLGRAMRGAGWVEEEGDEGCGWLTDGVDWDGISDVEGEEAEFGAGQGRKGLLGGWEGCEVWKIKLSTAAKKTDRRA